MNKIATAKIKYLRISPRKMAGVCKLVRGQDILVARSILVRTPKKGARIIEKALNSAVSNAKNKNMDEKRLILKEIRADMGPAYKRFIPWSKGSSRPIKKRTTHLTLVLEEKEGPKTKKQETKEIIKQENEDAKSVIQGTKAEKPKKIVKVKKTAKPKVTVKKQENNKVKN